MIRASGGVRSVEAAEMKVAVVDLDAGAPFLAVAVAPHAFVAISPPT